MNYVSGFTWSEYNWGEFERAPHKLVISVYAKFYVSDTESPLRMFYDLRVP